MQGTPITSSKLLEKPKDEIKWEENKKVISSMEAEKNEEERIFKKNTSFTSVLLFSNYCRKFPIGRKSADNGQGGATEEPVL